MLYFFSELKIYRLSFSIMTNMTLSTLLIPAAVVYYCRVSVAQWQSIAVRNRKVWGSIPHGDPLARDKTKNIFLYQFEFLQVGKS